MRYVYDDTRWLVIGGVSIVNNEPDMFKDFAEKSLYNQYWLKYTKLIKASSKKR